MKSAAKRTRPQSSTRRLSRSTTPYLRRGTRIDGEMRATRQPLIGTDVAEGMPAGEGNAFRGPQLDPIGHARPRFCRRDCAVGAGERQVQPSALGLDPGPGAYRLGARAIGLSGNSGCGARDMRRVNTTTTCSRSTRTRLVGVPRYRHTGPIAVRNQDRAKRLGTQYEHPRRGQLAIGHLDGARLADCTARPAASAAADRMPGPTSATIQAPV